MQNELESINTALAEAGKVQANTKTQELATLAPGQVTTLLEAEMATHWLRTKRKLDKFIDETFKPVIKAAFLGHKAALKASADAKAPSDTIAAEVRARIEAYAERPESELPEGVYRRKTFLATVTNAGLVPREFLSPDLEKIGSFLKRTEGKFSIPGVEFTPDVKITIRETEETNGQGQEE